MADDDDEDGFDTIDEAIAVALSLLDPGGTVTVHHPECSLGEDDAKEDDCDCSPMTLTKGAEA